MVRHGPFGVGIVALAMVLLGAAVYFVGARKGQADRSTEEQAQEPARADVPKRLPTVSEPTPVLHAPLNSPSATDALAPPGTLPSTERKDLLVAASNDLLIQQVDEKVFETLKVAEDKRASIRQINDDHARQTQLLLNTQVAGRTSEERSQETGAVTTPADTTRRSALARLLGPDGVKTFETAELSAALLLRRRYGK